VYAGSLCSQWLSLTTDSGFVFRAPDASSKGDAHAQINGLRSLLVRFRFPQVVLFALEESSARVRLQLPQLTSWLRARRT
jgi:hypothetical protein